MTLYLLLDYTDRPFAWIHSHVVGSSGAVAVVSSAVLYSWGTFTTCTSWDLVLPHEHLLSLGTALHGGTSSTILMVVTLGPVVHAGPCRCGSSAVVVMPLGHPVSDDSPTSYDRARLCPGTFEEVTTAGPVLVGSGTSSVV